MNKNNLLGFAFVLTLIVATGIVFSCGRINPSGPTAPVIARFDSFFGAMVNNRTTEVGTFISDYCVPSKESVIAYYTRLGGQAPITFKPNYCSYSVLSSSISGTTATLEIAETWNLTGEMDGSTPLTLSGIYPSIPIVYSLEAGVWQIISLPTHLHFGFVLSAVQSGQPYFIAGTLGTAVEHSGTTDKIHSPEVISTTTGSLSVWAWDNSMSGWVAAITTWENRSYSIRLTVKSTEDAPYDSYTFTHNFSIPTH